jgi:hypothetical protein
VNSDNIIRNGRFVNRATDLRELIDRLGWSQRYAAYMLELPERDFRRWCAGYGCPAFVVLALQYIVAHAPEGNLSARELMEEQFKP